MLDAFQHPFMQRAFLMTLIAAVPFGLIGTFVVVRRIGTLAGGIAHCAFGGIGIGVFLQYVVAVTWQQAQLAKWFEPMTVAVVVSVLAALVIGAVRLYAKEREDTLVGVIWVVGMSVGLLLLERTPGNVNVSHFLFGNILLITNADLFSISFLSVVVLVIVALSFKRLEAVCFDEEYAKLRGVWTAGYFQLLLVLTALTVVLLVRVVGVILVIAMLTLPAATAGRLTQRLLPMALLAVLFGGVASFIGLIVSYHTNIASGPTIVLIAATGYLLSFWACKRV